MSGGTSMKRLSLLLLLIGGLAWGQSSAPQAVKAKVGKQAVIQSKATGEVAWVWDRRYLPEDQTYHDKAQKTLVITSKDSATFLVTAVEHQPTKGFAQVEYLVTFEGGPAPPPGPDPPPLPPDNLTAQMRAAYQLDLKAGKLKPSEYRKVTTIFANAGDFLGLVSDVSNILIGLKALIDPAVTDNDMPNLKAVIAKHLAAVSKDNVPLTDELRKKFATAFGEIAKAMEGAEK